MEEKADTKKAEEGKERIFSEKHSHRGLDHKD